MVLTGAKTNDFENLILNYVLSTGATSSIVTGGELYLGLVTGLQLTYADESALTGPSRWHTFEVTGTTYARQRLRLNFDVDAAAGSISNSKEIIFGTSDNHPDGWGLVTGFIISTGAAINSTGTYYYGLFDTPKTIATGDSVRITSGNLTIEER